jgi:FkbM family methyltransferase
MTFISYAQNFEDIMLWRALKHVEHGFYIDVGANDPAVDSVTLAFYERGWRGINVEPMRQYYDLLLAGRPRDINLPVAVGDARGEITFFDVPDTGLSTMDPSIAQQHRDAGRQVIEERIQVVTLSEICEKYVQGEIHFLKIDVEGFEAAVLRGADFTTWRPWVLVIEATRPQTQITAHDEWEHMVLGAGYRFAYFDGLNQFYVAQEHAELLSAFRAPPNFFDDFQLRAGHYFSYPVDDGGKKLFEAENRALEAEIRARAAEAEFARAEAEAFKAQDRVRIVDAQMHQANEQIYQLNTQIASVLSSTSWRVTRPLRGLKQLLRQPVKTFKRVMPPSFAPKTLAKRVAGRIARSIIARPRLHHFIMRQVARFPFVHEKIRALKRRLAGAPISHNGADASMRGKELHKLSASARRVLADIDRNVRNTSQR